MATTRTTTLSHDVVRTSSLACLQQAFVLSGVLLSGVWIGWMWPRYDVVVVSLLSLLIAGYSLVLAIEVVAGAIINRSDPVPRATALEWLGAWWQEVKVAPKVFAWRQPFRWRTLPDNQVASGSFPPAVIFIHGFLCNRGFWLPWMERLKALGVPYVSVNLEPIFGSIDDYAPLVDAAVTTATALTGKPPTLICHSMGGLAARAWVASAPDAASRVHKIITIGTPHRGTWLARFSHLDNGRQMRLECDWQLGLEKRELALNPERNAARFVCWFSNTDNIVFPASTATLPGADNRLVVGAAHVALAFHPRVMEESLAMVASAGRLPSERTAS
jgi:pimeloyl-ACP methyl ester carboxylesterase